MEDVAGKGAFDEAIKGVDIVAHTASPFVSMGSCWSSLESQADVANLARSQHYNFTDAEKEMLIPALEGTRQILRAAQKVRHGVR